MTPLHWAVKRRNIKACEILIKNNSNINSKDLVLMLISDRKNSLVYSFIHQKFAFSIFTVILRGFPMVYRLKWDGLISETTAWCLRIFRSLQTSLFRNLDIYMYDDDE